MKKPTNLFIIILVAISFGAFAGVMSSIVSNSYFGRTVDGLAGANELNLADSVYSRANLIIRDAKKVVVNQDVKIDETIASLQPVLLSAFKKEDGKKDYYVLDDADAYGLILSSDGWILLGGFKDNVLKDGNLTEEIKKYTVISYDKKMYDIDKAVSVKVAGDGSVILAHLKSAANLSVRKMAYASDLKPGTTLLVVSPSGRTMVSSLISKKRPALQLTSDRPDISLELADTLGSEFNNSLIFNLGGDFVGFLDSTGGVRPNYVFLPAWRSLVTVSKTSFPYLGVNYLDLSAIKATGVKVDKGAWLKSIDANHSAIIKGSPAELAGLKDGDIIIRIDDQEIDSTHDLAEIISAYSAGDSIYVAYDRNGVQSGFELKLGEIK
jgi:hypothetical protein